MRADLRKKVSLFENRVGVDGSDRTPVGDPQTGRERPIDGIPAHLPRSSHEPRKLLPVLPDTAAEALERLAAAAVPGEDLLEGAVRILDGSLRMDLMQPLVALVEPREHAPEVRESRLVKGANLFSVSARRRIGIPKRAATGLGDGAGAVALGVELSADQLNLIHGRADKEGKESQLTY